MTKKNQSTEAAVPEIRRRTRRLDGGLKPAALRSPISDRAKLDEPKCANYSSVRLPVFGEVNTGS
jgi:hypothetical protein